MTAFQFTTRLDDVRREVRRRLIAYGVFAIATGGIVAFFTVIFLDWALGLPPILRLLGAVLFVLGFVGAAYHWIGKPLQARMSLQEMAWRLEAHFPALRDRLVSAVEFADLAAETSRPLAQQSLARAEEAVRETALHEALTRKPLVLRAITCSGAALLLIALLSTAPNWIKIGTTRYLSPWGPTQWPRTVLIAPLTHDMAVPIGESARVSMRIGRGFTDKLRPTVHLRAGSGRVETLGLQQESSGEFSTTIDSITEDLRYWFEAGDDDTRDRAGLLHVVRRPHVLEATAIIEPPPYAHSVTRAVDLANGSVEVTMGGSLRFMIRLNKPLPTDQVTMRGSGGIVLPFAETDTSMAFLSGIVVVEHDDAFYADLVDEHGFTNHGSVSYELKALPDRPPTVSIVEPKATLEVTPSASIALVFQATDDFGISTLELTWNKTDDAHSQVISLIDAPIKNRGDDFLRHHGGYEWDLAQLDLKAGDTLRYHLSVTDNRVLPGQEPQQSSSQPRELKIITELQLQTQVREDLLLVESQLRQVILHQEAIEDRTEELSRTADATAGLSDLQLQVTASLAGRESRLIEKTNELVSRLDAVSGRLALNRNAEAELTDLVKAASASLEETINGEMTQVVRSFSSIDAQVPEDQLGALVESQTHQQNVLDELRSVNRRLAQWGSFQGLVTRTRELLDRQMELREQTAEAGRSLMGKPLSSLTDEEMNELKNIEGRQRQVAADLDQHLAQMREHQAGIAQRDPAGAETIDAALRAERANRTSDLVQSAADAIAENRTAAASIDQRSAVESLRKLIATLQERQKRELEELRKKVADAEDQVVWLIEHQKSLLSATTEAGLVGAQRDTYASLAEQQGTLAQNTVFTVDELAEIERAASVAEVVERAVEPMQRARQNLADLTADAASAAQQGAIEFLESALFELQKLSQVAADEWLRQSLDRIHDHLAALLDAQRGVDRGIGELRAELQSVAKMGRVQTRRAAQLAREQADARSLIGSVLPDLKAVPVYEWALDRVAKWMDATSGKLISREIDDDLVATSARIVRELEKLVRAIVDTQSLPMNEEFIEAEGSGGGSSGGQASAKPVPTVAELLVLKAMQEDLAVRTAEFQESFNAADTSETQLRVLSLLGEDQAQLRRLAELVTEKARNP